MLKHKPLTVDWLAISAHIPIVIFITPQMMTHRFAHVLDSLVRVSRRVKWKQLDTMGHATMVTHSHNNAYITHCVSIGQHNPTLAVM